MEVIGGVYDVAFPPMKALADVLHPILDGAKTVIDTITCVRGAPRGWVDGDSEGAGGAAHAHGRGWQPHIIVTAPRCQPSTLAPPSLPFHALCAAAARATGLGASGFAFH